VPPRRPAKNIVPDREFPPRKTKGKKKASKRVGGRKAMAPGSSSDRAPLAAAAKHGPSPRSLRHKVAARKASVLFE
jgi:hypothetical protein